jgi:hypothetical protein
MAINEFFDALGVKGSVAAAGLAGGLLRSLSRRNSTWYERLASPICGALAAAYLTTPVLHYLYSINWPLPEDPVATMNAAAFLTGASAMWISDLLLEVMGRWVRGART